MTNLFRPYSVANLLGLGEAWKQPMALKRLTKRPSDGRGGWGLNGRKANRGKWGDLVAGVRLPGVRAFTVLMQSGSKDRACGKSGQQNRA